MTAQHGEYSDEHLIERPALTFPALRAAIAVVAPSRLPELFESMQRAFVRAGEENSVLPIHLFHREWAVAVEIERFPATAARLHAAERAMDDADPAVRDRAVREAGDIVRAAHAEVAAGCVALGVRPGRSLGRFVEQSARGKTPDLPLDG